MDNEDIRAIAEGMEIYARMDCDEVIVYKYNADTDRYRYQATFDPLNNWNDCGMVLEALVKKKTIQIGFNALGEFSTNAVGVPMLTDNKSVKESICMAYLELIK